MTNRHLLQLHWSVEAETWDMTIAANLYIQ